MDSAANRRMKLKPKDHSEQVALFRAQLLGPVLHAELARGELLAELRVLATRRFLPPGSDTTRTYSVPTLLRWRRAYLAGGLDGLRPESRRLGDALALTGEQRELLLEIRRQHPAVPANVILATLEGDGRLERGQVTAQTLRRLYRRENLSRRAKAKAGRPQGERRRWEARFVGDLWHADVCHGKTLVVGDKRIPVRVHALLDDKSRYVVALRVFGHEREVAMLELLVEAIRICGAPRRLLLDNGSTYSGEALATVCGRLGIELIHARPYDPQARGKMERFWRTMRQGCLDPMGPQSSLHDIGVRLTAFLTERYHKAAHAGLLGASPAKAWMDRRHVAIAQEDLDDALTVREWRRVRGDCTVSVGNLDWELADAFLAGHKVTIARTLSSPAREPWVEHEGARYRLQPVDPVANGLRKRGRRKPRPGIDAIDFDPAAVLLNQALRRSSRGGAR
jgi:putative transposase